MNSHRVYCQLFKGFPLCLSTRFSEVKVTNFNGTGALVVNFRFAQFREVGVVYMKVWRRL